MNSGKKVPIWIYLCIAITACLSLASLSYRHKVEDRNREVAIAAEADAVEALSASQGLSFADGLAELKNRGLTSVVLSEQYAGELFSLGQLQTVEGGFVEGPADVVQRLQRGVRNRFPTFGSVIAANARRTATKFPNMGLVRSVSVGLDPVQAGIAQDQHLMIIARFANPESASSETVTQTLAWAKELGAKVILPEGAQVLGRKDSLDAFTDGLGAYDLDYASPEFGKIGGDEEVVDKVPDRVVRLHSAQPEELDKMKMADAVDRYAKAARERNQRVLLLRPLSSAAGRPLSDFGDFIANVKAETEKEGGIVGIPHPFTEPGLPSILFPLIGLSLVPLFVWTVSAFLKPRWILVLAGLIALALGTLCMKPIGRSLDALLAAITLPTLAFIVLDRRNSKYWLLEYVVITLISLTGGLAVAGLLNALPYYIHAKQFMGVKFAHFFPIALIGGYFFYRFGLVKKSLSSPVEWGKALLAILVLIALAFMIERTGNDNPATVSDLELKMRSILDLLLFVRPRTKEFLIGHPFLIIGLGMLISLRNGNQRMEKWKGWITLFLMLGAIGQTSIVNTMCHIHTPLSISLARIGVGFVVGGILGSVLWGVLGRAGRISRPAEG